MMSPEANTCKVLKIFPTHFLSFFADNRVGKESEMEENVSDILFFGYPFKPGEN